MVQQRYKYAKTERPEWITANLPTDGQRFMLLVEQGENGSLTGSVHNLFLEEPFHFCGLADAVLQMDEVLNTLETPQASMRARNFWMTPECRNDTKLQRDAYYEWLHQKKTVIQQYWKPQYLMPQEEEKNRAVFYITVRFRQHSSWQGDVAWKLQKRRIPFRSVLELLHLLQSAFWSDTEKQRHTAERL